MTLTEAQRVHDAHQTARGKPPPTEYMRYMDAKRVMAAGGRLTLTAGQRAFLASVRWPSGMGPNADAGGATADEPRARAPAFTAAEFPATTNAGEVAA